MPRKKKTETEEQVEEEKEETSKDSPDVGFSIDVFSDSHLGKEEKKEDSSMEKKKKELGEKAKKLAGKIEIKDKKDIKGEVEASKRKKTEGILLPLDDYVKYSAHLGTKAVTPNMRQFVYRRRADGIAVLNTTFIDKGIKEAADFLKNYKPEDVFLACKREAGWTAAKKFGEVTGIRIFTKKYPAGIITNLKLKEFFETELVIISDPWLDKNALNDAVRIKRPVVALCDTNNLTNGVTKIIPCNNKAAKAIGLVFYLLAKEYLKSQGKKEEAANLKVEDFTGVEEESYLRNTPEKTAKSEEKEKVEKIKVGKGAEEGV